LTEGERAAGDDAEGEGGTGEVAGGATAESCVPLDEVGGTWEALMGGSTCCVVELK
jgi:hypothetical protein